MPKYSFKIKASDRMISHSELVCEDDDGATARANTIAIGLALDKPDADEERCVVVYGKDWDEIARVRVYSSGFAFDHSD